MTPTIPYLVAESRQALGELAATDIASQIRLCLAKQPTVRIIFAAAPSQTEMLAALILAPGIEWQRVIAFHMDEYLGLPAHAPQRFALWLDRHLFNHLPFAAVHRLQPDAAPEAFADSYAALLNEAPIDIVCAGIGSNGHLAFNDPPADFHDTKTVKIVTLDAACRQQQVDDLCFATFADVPTQALTLTVPCLLAAKAIVCCVPGTIKRDAVTQTITGPLTEVCPASILRQHPNCKLYLDPESAAGLPA